MLWILGTAYLLKKSTQALSGQVKTTTLTFGAAERFPIRTLQDTNIIEILSVYDSNGNRWYEVPYLAQDFIYPYSMIQGPSKIFLSYLSYSFKLMTLIFLFQVIFHLVS